MNSAPKVSVLMTAYNAEPFVRQAIESILAQSFKDFEFIIINDGSSDGTLKTIESFSDRRIRLISRRRMGRHFSLEEGIKEARGQYLAIMDSDDIAMPERLQKQVAYLDRHPECAVVASRIRIIDEVGDSLPDWPADKNNLTPEQIKKCMPHENCVANPSITGRTDLFKKFGYNKRQVAEDHDLWLRLLSAGHSIHKINKILLSYRIHPESITQTSNRLSVSKKVLKTKLVFLENQLIHFRFGKIEFVVLRSFLGLFLPMLWRKSLYKSKELMIVPLKATKNFAKRIINRIFPPPPRLLVVLPWLTMGGADKIVLDIISLLKARGVKVYCITTLESKNEWRPHFEEVCEVIDAHKDGNVPQFIANFVAANDIDIVLTSNNIAGYVAAGLIKAQNPSVRVFDLIHGQGGKAENGGWPLHSVPYDASLDRRLVATEYMRDYLVTKFGISEDRITVIHNGIDLPTVPLPPPADEIVKNKGSFIVLWAGRFNVEKHPEHVVSIAKAVAAKEPNIHFIMAGDGYMKPEILAAIRKEKLQKIVTVTKGSYANPRTYMGYVNALLMTSEMEGLPLVILEAMSEKLPVVAPKVGGIPELVENDKNGYLVPYSKKMPAQMARRLLELYANPRRAAAMGEYGYQKARRDFSNDKMAESYAQIFNV